jgi:sn-glycerol 3-phosphate transport system permease protein
MGEAMIENRPGFTFLAHLTLVIGIAIVALPIYVTFVASTQEAADVLKAPIPMLPGARMIDNYGAVVGSGLERASSGPVGPMMLNSLVMALGIAVGKIAISILSAFAIVYFRFPGRMLAFWTIFVTLMLPVEVRIVPTYEVVANLGLLNSYAGLTIPLIASATATFLFRQFFLTIPDELAEAARVDGAGPMKFFWDILLPLSRTNIAALFVILFIYGWNQYLWPLLVTTDESMYTIVMAIQRMVTAADNEPEWHYITAVAILALLPPVAVVVGMQRWFVKGLIETEK